MYTKILVPLDDSDTAIRGLRQAIAWAKPTGAELVLLHVIDSYKPMPLEAAFTSVGDTIAVLARERAERLLHQPATDARMAGLTVHTRTRQLADGHRIADEIAAEAAAQNCDLIVIGSHGRRGFSRFALGSDAEELVRTSLLPVLVVLPPAAGEKSAAAVDRPVLVPVEESEVAQLGLETALGLASTQQRRLRLVHVVDAAILGLDPLAFPDYNEVIASLSEAGRKLLDRCEQLASARGVAVESVLRVSESGRVAALITEEAKACGCDLVVMGTHGRRGLDRVVLGSDAAAVLRASHVPVLLVRGATP